jgi:RNA polymerase sigma factor (sigma-70 family)
VILCVKRDLLIVLSLLAMVSAPPVSLSFALRTDRERTLKVLYRQAFPLVRRHVRRHGGSEADAQDVFQDALVIFYEKAVAETLTLTVAPSQYVAGVGRNLWHRELQRRTRLVTDTLTEAHADHPAEDGSAEPATQSVLAYVERLGARCRAVLLAFYYFRQPLDQIAAEHQYASVRSATVQKYKCLERLRNAVRTVADAAEAFLTA